MPRTLHTAQDVYKHVLVGAPSACWLWTRAVSTNGYGQFYFDGRLHTAHRVAWELDNGPVPEGLQLDHLCRNRRCCNPRHLEPVTGSENVARSPLHFVSRTHCPQGHPYSGDNLYVRPKDGARVCRACKNADRRERKRRRRAEYRPQAARDDGPGCPGTTKPGAPTVPDAASSPSVSVTDHTDAPITATHH